MLRHPTILAFGDSLTAGYGLPADQSFPMQLEARLQETWAAARVINAGMSGDTSATGRTRLPRVLAGLSKLPDLAIVALGANDLLRGINPMRTRSDIDAILHLLKQVGIPALLVGLIAPPFLGPSAQRFNAIYTDISRSNGVPFASFSLSDFVGNKTLTLSDSLHPNGKAIGIVVEQMLPLVAAALRKAGPYLA